jgi:Pyruvate/2-oxoglutarate dehydrogenase complex, dehydrogenase (E1) component, eukaryotic type, alpha subunit
MAFGAGDDDEDFVDLFRKIARIRMVEEKIIDIYHTDKIQSPVHLSIGQEPIAVGICAPLRATDLLFATYRSHAFYLAKGGNLDRMFAELYGKVDGGCKGKAGSMHLTAPEVGFMGSSAVVASSIPHAVGAALAARRRGLDQVVVAVFGDGATEEGVFHESINFAALHRLPVLFVCENNEYAVHSHIRQRQAYSLSGLAGCYGIPVALVEDGHDARLVRETFAPMVERARRGGGPEFLEVKTCRFREHVGPGEDLQAGYRDAAVVRDWAARDPLSRHPDLLARLAPHISAEIDAAMTFAENSPLPGAEELLTDVL